MVVILIILLLLFWIVSVVNCEVLTERHGSEFIEVSENLKKTIKIDAWKVIKYSERYAEVYFYSEYGGILVSLDFVDGKWEVCEWEASWSKMGSADDIVWPYIR